MTYEKIAKDIIDLVSNDYSGCKELQQNEAKNNHIKQVPSLILMKNFII